MRACLDGSRLRAALDHAETYLRDHLEHRHSRYLVATLYVSLDQGDMAELELEQLLAEHPNDAEAHYLSGVIAIDSEPRGGEEALSRLPRSHAAGRPRRRGAEPALPAYGQGGPNGGAPMIPTAPSTALSAAFYRRSWPSSTTSP